MRKFKFRAWLKNHNEIVNVLEIRFHYRDIIYKIDEQGNKHAVDFEDCELMQYTELNDKNDQEIYEGHIMTCNFEPKKFIIDNGNWISAEDTPHHVYGFSFCDDPAKCEIIGNIHENGDLLK